MACTAVRRYLPLSGCLGIIIEAVNLKTRLAFYSGSSDPGHTLPVAFVVFGNDNKMRKRSILTAIQVNAAFTSLVGGRSQGSQGWRWVGWIVGFFFFFGLLDRSNISVPFMLLIYVETCACKISISEKGVIFRYYFSLFSPLRSSKVKSLWLVLFPSPNSLFRGVYLSQGTTHCSSLSVEMLFTH